MPPTTADLARACGITWALAWGLLHDAEQQGQVLSWPDDLRDRRWLRWTPPLPVPLDPVAWGPPLLR